MEIMEKKINRKEAKKIYLENHKRIVDETADGFVVLKNIGKVYGSRVQAVYNFNLSIKKNEFIVLVGPSGCGKSTTLRMVAGLEEITNGRLFIDGLLANYLESKDRDIAMVFQSYALYPNMTVYDNIGFGLSVRKEPKAAIREKVYDAARILDLGAYLDRKPKELSGGQMQRVALGRAIVRNAKLFLMDEPLSNLDAKLRVQMRSEIVKLHREIGATTIYVTHDQTEAMTMADRIVVMNKGIIQQVGTPMEIYNRPQNIFVATFIGNPPMNVFGCEIKDGKISDGKNTLVFPDEFMKRYGEFIEKRRKFFVKTVRDAEAAEERALGERISSLLSLLKKLPATELRDRAAEIAAKMYTIAEEKGYFSFSEEEKRDLLEAAETESRDLLRSLLKAALERLKETDLAVAGILKEVESAGLALKKEETPTEEGKKKKSAHKTAEPTLAEENLRKAKGYLEAYGTAGAENRAMVGIRPENICFADGFSGNGSEKFTVTAEFVELLGSEYCIHFDLFGARLIMKAGVNRSVRIGEIIEICFDMNKLKLFDAVSGTYVCG